MSWPEVNKINDNMNVPLNKMRKGIKNQTCVSGLFSSGATNTTVLNISGHGVLYLAGCDCSGSNATSKVTIICDGTTSTFSVNGGGSGSSAFFTVSDSAFIDGGYSYITLNNVSKTNDGFKFQEFATLGQDITRNYSTSRYANGIELLAEPLRFENSLTVKVTGGTSTRYVVAYSLDD